MKSIGRGKYSKVTRQPEMAHHRRAPPQEDVAKQEWIVAEEAVAAQVVATKVKANEEATAKVKDEAEEPTCAATKVNVDAEKVEQKRIAAANAEAHP